MDLINSFFHFFTDRSRHFGTKATLILTLIIMVFLADNLFSFSYYYNNSQKISQAKELTEILKESSLTKYEREQLTTLRTNIIDHSTWKDKVWGLFSTISFDAKESPDTEAAPTVIRSYDWHFWSSAWIPIIVMIIMPIALIFDRSNSLSENLFILVIIEPMCMGIAWLLAKSFSYIPVIYGNPIFNYILNVVVCSLVFLLIAILYAFDQRQKSKKANPDLN